MHFRSYIQALEKLPSYTFDFTLIDHETNESTCFMQMIANILGQGSQLREYAMHVEEHLRQVELESIQAS